jgi:hypothetical protein
MPCTWNAENKNKKNDFLSPSFPLHWLGIALTSKICVSHISCDRLWYRANGGEIPIRKVKNLLFSFSFVVSFGYRAISYLSCDKVRYRTFGGEVFIYPVASYGTVSLAENNEEKK